LFFAPILGPLEDASTFLELAGVVLGLITAAHSLVLVCAKALTHTELEHVVAAGIKDVIRGPHAGDATSGADTLTMRQVQQTAGRQFDLRAPDLALRSVKEHSDGSPVPLRPLAHASATPPEVPHQDPLWLCLGFVEGRPEPAEAPKAASGDAGDVIHQLRKVVVLPVGADGFLDTPPDVLRCSTVSEVDVRTAKTISGPPAGQYFIVNMEAVGVDTFNARGGSQSAYLHPGCRTGRCTPPDGRCRCLYRVCRPEAAALLRATSAREKAHLMLIATPPARPHGATMDSMD
jgi:hypothetical protein